MPHRAAAGLQLDIHGQTPCVLCTMQLQAGQAAASTAKQHTELPWLEAALRLQEYLTHAAVPADKQADLTNRKGKK